MVYSMHKKIKKLMFRCLVGTEDLILTFCIHEWSFLILLLCMGSETAAEPGQAMGKGR